MKTIDIFAEPPDSPFVYDTDAPTRYTEFLSYLQAQNLYNMKMAGFQLSDGNLSPDDELGANGFMANIADIFTSLWEQRNTIDALQREGDELPASIDLPDSLPDLPIPIGGWQGILLQILQQVIKLLIRDMIDRLQKKIVPTETEQIDQIIDALKAIAFNDQIIELDGVEISTKEGTLKFNADPTL